MFLILFSPFASKAQMLINDLEKTSVDNHNVGFLKLYPNPLREGNEITVVFESELFATVTITFLDALGNLKYEVVFITNPNEKEYIVKTDPLTKGVYMFKITNTINEELIVRKLLVE